MNIHFRDTLYIKNLLYSKKNGFLIKNQDIVPIEKYFGKYLFCNEKNMKYTKCIKEPVLVINILHSCFSHALIDSLFSIYWVICDIRKKFPNFKEFVLFIREKEIKEYPKQNLPTIDNTNKTYKNIYKDLIELVTPHNLIFEHLIEDNEIILIENCFIYILNDSWQRSPWNCINYYPGRKISINNVKYSDDIIRKQLNIFTDYVKNRYDIIDIFSKTTNIIIINRKTSYRNINNILKKLDKLLKNKEQTCNNIKYNGVVYLENLTLKEQINIFQINNIIITPHGSGLIHSIWFNKKTIIEIFFESNNNKMYKRINNLIGNKIIQVGINEFMHGRTLKTSLRRILLYFLQMNWIFQNIVLKGVKKRSTRRLQLIIIFLSYIMNNY